MPRTIKSGLELAFHARSNQWCKYYTEAGKNKVKYFGKGKSAKDVKSYRAALRKYKTWQQQRVVDGRLEQFRDLIAMVEAGTLPVSELGDSPLAQRFIQDQKHKGRVDATGRIATHIIDPDKRDPENDDDWLGPELPDDCSLGDRDDVLAARARVIQADREQREDLRKRQAERQAEAKVTKAKTSNKKTIRQWAELWVGEYKESVAAGDKAKLTAKNMWQAIKTFVDHVEAVNGKHFKNEVHVDGILKDYRSMILGKVADWRTEFERLEAEGVAKPKPARGIGYSPNTANTKFKRQKAFLGWCYEQNALKVLPRALNTYTKRLHVDKQGYPFELDVVRKLWDSATDDRMRAWICLGLNVGFKGGDIATLKGSMIKGDRLQGVRHKTKKLKVPMNYKLWPITQELIARTRETQGDHELLWTNTKGQPYESSNFSGNFNTLRKRADVIACFEQFRDTGVDWIEKAIIADGTLDRGLLQIYMAHKDGSTAKYYTNHSNPAALKTPELDKLIDKFDIYLGLKLPDDETI